jgi:hypothetical protein
MAQTNERIANKKVTNEKITNKTQTFMKGK